MLYLFVCCAFLSVTSVAGTGEASNASLAVCKCCPGQCGSTVDYSCSVSEDSGSCTAQGPTFVWCDPVTYPPQAFSEVQCDEVVLHDEANWYTGGLLPGAPDWGAHYFAPYVNVTTAPGIKLSSIHRQTGIKHFMLQNLMNRDGATDCQVTWGGKFDIATGPMQWNAASQTYSYLYTEINQLRQQGGDVGISFYGHTQNLVDYCLYPNSSYGPLKDAYQSAIDAVQATYVDFAYDDDLLQTNDKTIDDLLDALWSLKPSTSGKLIKSITLKANEDGLTYTSMEWVKKSWSEGVYWDVYNVLMPEMTCAPTADDTIDQGKCAISAVDNVTNQIFQLRNPNAQSKFGWLVPIDVYAQMGQTFQIGAGQNKDPRNFVWPSDLQYNVAHMYNNMHYKWLSFMSLERDHPCSTVTDEFQFTCSSAGSPNGGSLTNAQTKDFEFAQKYRSFKIIPE